MSWPTVEELASYMQTTIAEDDPTALLLLELARGVVRARARQHFDYVADDVITIDAPASGLILLPERPVLEVSEVVLDGDTLTVLDEWDWNRAGHLTRPGDRATWGLPTFRTVTVTYTHGYADGSAETTLIPDDVRAVVLAAAARAWQSPTAVAQESIGGYSVTYLRDSNGVFLSEGEGEILDRYRVEGLA